MNAKAIIECLMTEGISVRLDKGNLHVHAERGKFLDRHREILKSNKEILVDFLSGAAVPSTAGGQEPLPLGLAPPTPSKAKAPKYFKEYHQPDGTTLQLTKEAFDSVVDLFRTLRKQDLIVQKQRGKVG